MEEFITSKYGKAFLTFLEPTGENTVACFLNNEKIVIRKRKLTSKRGTTKIKNDSVIETLKEILLQYSSFEDLIANFEVLEKYKHINKDTKVLEEFIDEVDSFRSEVEELNFSKDGFQPHYLLLHYLVTYELIEDIDYRYSLNELNLLFLKSIGAIPKSPEKTEEFREGIEKNSAYSPNQLVKEFMIADKYILYIHQGKFSTYDMLLKYRVYESNSWSRIRTPKHIHWAVDLLLKRQSKKDLTINFLDELIKQWEKRVKPLTTNKERNETIVQIFKEFPAKEFGQLDSSGEYPSSFLWIIAILLMYQEKTNYDKAYMFGNLLDSLRTEEGIYKVISTATHR